MSSIPATILVVDDNPATRYSTSRVLRGAGWNVVEAGTGTEAISIALQGIDLVVLDINLPDIDGYSVCRTLRARETTSRLPILHLSASFTSSDHKVTGLESGADGYLTHPVEPPVLIATVNAFLRTRQTEIELRMSEGRFRAVFENALTGVALFDENLNYVDVNPTMCGFLNIKRTEVVGENIERFVPENEISTVRLARQQLDENLAWHGTLPIVRSDGSTLAMEWHLSIHEDPGLKLAIVSDISDRVRYERERELLLLSERTARAEAERANRLKDDFLATLSHELRTPLNAIVGWSQLVRTGRLPPKEFDNGLEAIERNARVQAQMIADLLDVSRITSGKLRLDIDLQNVTDIVNAALSDVIPTARVKLIDITTSYDSDAGLIQGDASRIQQVVWNLVNNAVKFTPEHGQINVSVLRNGNEIEIRVADNGCGIDAELLPRIFERFRQGDSSSTRHYGGLGLGLSIAKQLVDLHQGRIYAESEGPGKGSEFIVVLPVWHPVNEETLQSPQMDRVRLPLPSLIPPSLKGVRVLLVEDDIDSRNMSLRIIADSGADVVTSSTVNQALEQLDTFNPNILVSDLGMPGRDGFDLIREIRRRGYSAEKLPAIALTAFVQVEDRNRALSSGFQMHLTKPINPHHLVSAMASVLAKSRRQN